MVTKEHGDKQQRILLVSQDQAQVSLLHQALVGFDRHAAASSDDAVHHFKHDSPDITIVDLDMPHDQGWHVLREVRAFDARAFVVGIAASKRYADQRSALDAGASAYIAKPFSRQALLEQIQLYAELAKRRAVQTAEERSRNYEEKLLQEGAQDEVRVAEAPHVSVDDILKCWNILLVDPAYINREQARKALSQLCCRVVVAANEEDARERVALEDFDLMFINISLRDVDGYQLAYEFRQVYMPKQRQPYIIGMVERSGDDYGSQRWLVAGMDEVVYKPYPVAQLRNRVIAYAEQFKKELGADYAEYSLEAKPVSHTVNEGQNGDGFRQALGHVHQALSHGLGHAAVELLRDVSAMKKQAVPEAAGLFPRVADLHEGMLLLKHFVSLSMAQPTLSALSLEEVLSDVALAIKPELERIKGSIRVMPLPEVMGNRVQLTQLFLHLIGNAIKYRSTKPPVIQVNARREAGNWRIDVVDNGRGIDPAARQVMFVPFQRLHEDGDVHGHGLGLAICKRIAELHGSNIGVESTVGEGSRFFFHLRAV